MRSIREPMDGNIMLSSLISQPPSHAACCMYHVAQQCDTPAYLSRPTAPYHLIPLHRIQRLLFAYLQLSLIETTALLCLSLFLFAF
jgi:hypothetical protein